MELREDIKKELEKLKAVHFPDLARAAELGIAYSFKEASDTLEKVYQDLDNVAVNIDLLRLSKNQEDRILSIARHANEYIEQIQKFVLKGNEANASNEHTQIHERVKNLYQEDLEHIVPILERVEILKLRPAEIQSEVAKIAESKEEIANLLKEAKKSKENLDTTIKEIRDSFGAEGASISAKDFQDQAIEHKGAAKKWMIASIVSIIIFVVVASFLFFHNKFRLADNETNYARIAQISLFKIVILSIGYLVIYQCLKNFKVNNHLYVVNKHRQLTLSVYPLMTGATSDPEQSHIILGNAAKAIFDQSNTGYLDGDDNPNPVNLTEIINKFTDKNTK